MNDHTCQSNATHQDPPGCSGGEDNNVKMDEYHRNYPSPHTYFSQQKQL